MFKGLFRAGRLRDIEEIYSTWISESRAEEGWVQWGKGPLGNEPLNRLHYNPDGLVTEQFASTHRLLHELGHLSMIDPDRMVRGDALLLAEAMQAVRAKTRSRPGMSAVGSWVSYATHRKPHEDAADLFGMLTHSEAIYVNYMQFLQNDREWAVVVKSRNGVATIGNRTAHTVDYLLRRVHDRITR